MNRKQNLSEATTVVASREHVSCTLEDELVILSLKTGEYYGLNAVATSIWTLIQEPKTVTQLVDALLEEYVDVTREQCLTEVMPVLEQMAELQLIRLDGAASSSPAEPG
jgi:hypothetical protein